MQKELDDLEYWKNRNGMKFNSMKYMVMHLGINDNNIPQPFTLPQQIRNSSLGNE